MAEENDACSVAHGETAPAPQSATPPPSSQPGPPGGDRALVAVFASAVAGYLLRYAADAGYRCLLVDPDPVRASAARMGGFAVAEAAFGQLDYAGTLVIVGTGFDPPRFNQNRMIIFELEVIGAYNYNDEGFAPAVDLLSSGTLPLQSLIEPDDIPLTDVMVTMERLARGEIPSKVMVQPGLPT